MVLNLSEINELASVVQHGRWEASLALGFAARGDKTVLKHRARKGPLSVQRALYPEGGVCHSYLLHPPGGVVGGDCLSVQVSTEAGAQALMTTPGATRFYRSDGLFSTLNQQFDLAAQSRLEWLPLENIAFPDAHAELNTRVNLKPGSQFVGWDIWLLGQPASGQSFETGAIDGNTQIWLEETLLLNERFRIQPRSTQRYAATLRDYCVSGSLYAYGDIDGLLATLKSWQEQHTVDVELGMTHIDGLLVVRGLSHRTDVLFEAFASCWQQIRQHWTGECPDIPRIWRT